MNPSPVSAERGRYHLYISHACPYSARTVLVRCVKQLQDVVSMSALDPVRGPDGWMFGSGEHADPLNGFRSLRQAYEATDAGYEGRASVPVLWDKQTRRIVSTQSGDIVRLLGSAWNAVGGDASVDPYPEPLRSEIDALNEWIGTRINDAVYDVGTATRQVVYEREHRKLLAALDELEQRLAGSRFLLGDRPVECDWRLFPTLVRFDAVYAPLFKCTRRLTASCRSSSRRTSGRQHRYHRRKGFGRFRPNKKGRRSRPRRPHRPEPISCCAAPGRSSRP